MALEFDAARALILSHAKVLESEKVALGHSVGRVLAESIIAPWALPGADNSAMDGYAIAFKQNTETGRHVYRSINQPALIVTSMPDISTGSVLRFFTNQNRKYCAIPKR